MVAVDTINLTVSVLFVAKFPNKKAKAKRAKLAAAAAVAVVADVADKESIFSVKALTFKPPVDYSWLAEGRKQPKKAQPEYTPEEKQRRNAEAKAEGRYIRQAMFADYDKRIVEAGIKPANKNYRPYFRYESIPADSRFDAKKVGYEGEHRPVAALKSEEGRRIARYKQGHKTNVLKVSGWSDNDFASDALKRQTKAEREQARKLNQISAEFLQQQHKE